MEEVIKSRDLITNKAELLCSKIGIFVTGELRCLGSSLHLRTKYADGYRLVINFHLEEEQKVSELVNSIFNDDQFSLKETATYKGDFDCETHSIL
jgi:hypothetical protein